MWQEGLRPCISSMYVVFFGINRCHHHHPNHHHHHHHHLLPMDAGLYHQSAVYCRVPGAEMHDHLRWDLFLVLQSNHMDTLQCWVSSVAISESVTITALVPLHPPKRAPTFPWTRTLSNSVLLTGLNVRSNLLRLIRDWGEVVGSGGKWGDGYLCPTTHSLLYHHQTDSALRRAAVWDSWMFH